MTGLQKNQNILEPREIKIKQKRQKVSERKIKHLLSSKPINYRDTGKKKK
jgi:hypothetical protein